MYFSNLSKRLIVVALLTISLAGGNALAERGERGGGGGHRSGGDGGDGGGGGGRSFSGGGGGGRSFSGGGEGGSSSRGMSSGHSSRSFSGGGEHSSRSFSGGASRSFSGGGEQSIRSFSGGSPRSVGGGGEQSIRSYGGGSSRSFSGRGEQSIRSFSGGSSSSLSEGSRNGPAIDRSFQGRSSIGNSSDGASSRIRAFGGESTRRSFESMGSNRDSRNVDSMLRGSIQGTPLPGGSGDGNSQRSLIRGSNDSPQFGRSFGNARSRGETASDSLNLGRRGGGDESTPLNREFDPTQGRSGDSQTPANNLGGSNSRGVRPEWNRSSRQDATGRPTNDQVRDFLQLRRDDATRQTANGGNRGLDRDAGRLEGNPNLGGNVPDGIRQWNQRNRGNDSQEKGDQAWAGRFGDANNNRGDRSPRRDENGPRDGDSDRRLGEADRPGDGRGGDDRKVVDARRLPDRNLRGHEFGDRDGVDRKYQDWRKDTWRGERGDGHDHRDQSGRWKHGDRFVAAHQVRDHWKGHHDHKDLPFRDGWWKGHHGHGHHGHNWHHWDHFAHHHHRPFFWWSWCPAPRLTTWITFGWQTPYYWDYGPGEYIYCYDNVVYVNGAWFQPAPVYYETTLVLAQRAPNWTPEQAAQVEWLPLGVFAMARDGVADNNVLVQLAVTKDGVIGGTLFNQVTGATFAIEGVVEKQTQRAVWTYVDETNARIVMETSVYNLTQPEATGLIHYGPDNIQVIQFVRLEEPAGGTPGPALGQPVLLAPTVAP